jgi:hypothetical protein
LYATHFPSQDEGRKKFGADAIAAVEQYVDGIEGGGNFV